MSANSTVFFRLLAIAASGFSLADPMLSVAATPDEASLASSIRCERRSEYAITREHEWRLTTSLRRITGLVALEFKTDGYLSLGDSPFAVGGSAEARRILISAVAIADTFVIEDHSRSNSVTFGQAAREQVFEPRDGRWSQVWRLRLDFDDFRQMNAPLEVKATFDEGFTLLHELLHGLGYEDGSRVRELGACEEIVNRVRSELGLPIRDQYFGEMSRVTEKLTSIRLRFRSEARNKNSVRWQSHYLSFLFSRQDADSR